VEDAPGLGVVLAVEAPVDVVISGAALAEAAVAEGDVRPSELCRAAVGFVQMDLRREPWLRQVGNGQVGGAGEALEVGSAGCFGMPRQVALPVPVGLAAVVSPAVQAWAV